MIGLLVVAHGGLGECLIECADYVLGARPERLLSLDLSEDPDSERLLAQALDKVAKLDDGSGVLILADIYGATPCNTVSKLIVPGQVEAVAGANLPMLLKAITYRREPLELVAQKAVLGAREGAFHIMTEGCDA